MKRIVIPGTLVCAMFLWYTSLPTFAGKETSKSATWEHTTFKTDRGTEQVLVLRLWDSTAADPKWPQLALLRLTPNSYKEIQKDPNLFKAFIDGKSVFNAPVTI